VTVAEWVFLRVLYDCDWVAPSRLVGEIGMTKGAISKLADRLLDKELVQREANVVLRRSSGRSLRGTN
jgi:DNA-binding MarR family transcriptional regulator